MTPQDRRWWLKANAMHAAWQRVFGEAPTQHAVELCLAVAQHETLCGDAWPGEYNWGAVQLRRLNEVEQAPIAEAGLAPNPDNVYKARRALKDAGIAEPAGALHVDSSPGKGWYWVYFCRFYNDTDGATRFIHEIAERRQSCKQVLESRYGTADMLAAAMYASHYFEGFRRPHELYLLVDGKWILQGDSLANGRPVKWGYELNILDYGGAVERILPSVRAALVSWQPGVEPPAELDLELVDALVARCLDELARGAIDEQYRPRGASGEDCAPV